MIQGHLVPLSPLELEERFDDEVSFVYNADVSYTWGPMRTNIIIDDALMSQALAVSGFKTKKETVEEGLRLLIVLRQQAKAREARGKLNWEGDLDRLRSDQ